MDAEGLQRAGNSDPVKAGEEVERLEAEVRQDMRVGVPYCWMQSEVGLPGLPEGVCGTGEARQRRLLATQVSGNVRDSVPLGGGRSADGAAVARSLGHGIDDEILEAVTKSADPSEGERDFRLNAFGRSSRSLSRESIPCVGEEGSNPR